MIRRNHMIIAAEEGMRTPPASLVLLLAFTAYPLEQSSAIAMSTSLGSFVRSSAAEAAGNHTVDYSFSRVGPSRFVVTVPVPVTTSPLNFGHPVAGSSRNFANPNSQSIWSRAQTLINLGAVGPLSSRRYAPPMPF
jgi:hypothetical protein